MRLFISLVLFSFLLPSCTTPIRDYVADASDRQEVVCGLAANTPPGDPTLDQVKALCEAGAPLQEIAAAYAGCGEAE